MTARLRPPGPPLRVAELLLPTVLTLAGRGPVSAANFLTLLATVTPDPCPAAGTRVTSAAPRTSEPNKAVNP
ncbi:hypothetical protein [Amycolatopsis sp. cmx-4-68]|uniref:hypothetical protein n=1 Tax=Amycolatopsis sp. cmx-4-68 TaxID=2790938 RepID=UPI00397C57B9